MTPDTLPTEPVTIKPEREQGLVERIVRLLIMRPEGVAVVAFLVLMGLITGILPSAITDDINSIKERQETIIQQHAHMEKLVTDAIIANQQEDEAISKLLRGICLLQARGSEDLAIRYCNP